MCYFYTRNENHREIHDNLTNKKLYNKHRVANVAHLSPNLAISQIRRMIREFFEVLKFFHVFIEKN